MVKIKHTLAILVFSSTLAACGGDGTPAPPPVTIGAIQIDSIGVAITYDEELIASSETVVEIAGGTPITNEVVFSDSPDNTITVNADLSTYTIGSNFTVDITANIEDAASNTGSTKITAIINP